MPPLTGLESCWDNFYKDGAPTALRAVPFPTWLTVHRPLRRFRMDHQPPAFVLEKVKHLVRHDQGRV